MEGYLGETDIDWMTSPEFREHTTGDWAKEWIERYGQIAGSHHKAWVLDQIMRILLGTPVIVKIAAWDNGDKEPRLSLGEPSSDYLAWALSMREPDEDGEEYYYDEGIAP